MGRPQAQTHWATPSPCPPRPPHTPLTPPPGQPRRGAQVPPVVSPLVVLIGRGWQRGVIRVPAPHRPVHGRSTCESPSRTDPWSHQTLVTPSPAQVSTCLGLYWMAGGSAPSPGRKALGRATPTVSAGKSRSRCLLPPTWTSMAWRHLGPQGNPETTACEPAAARGQAQAVLKHLQLPFIWATLWAREHGPDSSKANQGLVEFPTQKAQAQP